MLSIATPYKPFDIEMKSKDLKYFDQLNVLCANENWFNKQIN